MKQKSNENIVKAKVTALKKIRNLPEKDPTDRERIEKVKKMTLKAPSPVEAIASTLFVNFKDTCKVASARHYRDVLGLQFDKEYLVPTEEFIKAADQVSESTDDQLEIDINSFT